MDARDITSEHREGMAPPNVARVVYLTDLEGMGSRLDDFCRGNPWVHFEGPDRLNVADHTLFVFGGDAIDRGPDARRIVRVLLDVQRRQPERVVLLAGNRDLNKIRLRTELGSD